MYAQTYQADSLHHGCRTSRRWQRKLPRVSGEFEAIQSYEIIPLPLIVTVGIAEASDARALTAPMAAAFFMIGCV